MTAQVNGPADLYSLVARRKLNQPDGWSWMRLERIGPDATQVIGGVPRVLTRGPNKGERRWDKKALVSCVVTDNELKVARAEYEAETGRCSSCFGDGKSVFRVSLANGVEYRPCKDCGGTGKACDSVEAVTP